VTEVVPDHVQRALHLLEEIGAEDTEHPSGTLLQHLQGTYGYLERWGCPPAVCLAGLYHSVYGTDVFQTVTLRPEARGRVAAEVGAEAENLAYLYCALRRDSLYRNLEVGGPPYRVESRLDGEAIELEGRDQYADLLTIDLANRLEQMPRSRWSRERFADDRRRYEAAAPLLPPRAVEDLRRQPAPSAAARVARRLARRLLGR
jgi:hypothetical protein